MVAVSRHRKEFFSSMIGLYLIEKFALKKLLCLSHHAPHGDIVIIINANLTWIQGTCEETTCHVYSSVYITQLDMSGYFLQMFKDHR